MGRPAARQHAVSEPRKQPEGAPGKSRTCAGISPAMWVLLAVVAAISYVGTFVVVAWIAG